MGKFVGAQGALYARQFRADRQLSYNALVHRGNVPLVGSQGIRSCRRWRNVRTYACGIGKFERTRGDTYWLGVKENIALSALSGNVERELKLRGFLTEKRTFRPHVTLARDVRLYRDIRTKTPEINYSVTGFSLMRSDRISGRMKYSTVAHKEFKK